MRRLLVALLASLPLSSPAAVSVVDDTRSTITLSQPARRIVSLAPHTTEMLYAAGAGAYVVGVTQFSDFPPEAQRLPLVGSGIALDLERILQLKPDLVVGWNSTMAAGQMKQLEQLGIPVYRTEPRDFPGIPKAIEDLAHLAGTDVIGKAAAQAFRSRLQQLQTTWQQRRPVSVFYQIWKSPLMTLNGKHMVSAALRLCGGVNVFASLPQLVPTVSEEAVLKADPEAIIASSGEQDDVLAGWMRFPQMKAVARGNLMLIDADLLNRSGPRILDGTETLCKQLDAIRNKP